MENVFIMFNIVLYFKTTVCFPVHWRKGGKKEKGAPSEVRIFAGRGVEGSRVGGVRAVPRGRPAN